MKALIIFWIVVSVNFYTLSVDTTIDFELNKAYFAARKNIIYFKTTESEGKVVHPTQKPIALLNKERMLFFS